jgi:hypothetical protein
VNIDLYKAGSFCLNIVLATPSDGTHPWDVPLTISKADDYKVRITSVDKDWLFVESAANFSIGNPIITQFPYTEDFDNFNEGAGALGGFWEQEEDDDDLNWTVQSGATPSGTTGPDEDHTSGSGKYIFTEASSDGHPNKRFDALTPVFDFNYIADPELTFWFHMRSDTNRMGDLFLDVYADGSWDEGVLLLSGARDENWHDTTISLSAYDNKQIQLRFRGITDTSFDSDMAIDDIKIDGVTKVLFNTSRKPLVHDIAFYNAGIHYQIPENGKKHQHLSLKLYSLQGRLIKTLVNGNVPAGRYSIPLGSANNGNAGTATGLYLCKMVTEGFSKTIAVVLVK